jgi:hypothetical protein
MLCWEIATPTFSYATDKTFNESWISDVTSVTRPSQLFEILIGPCRLKESPIVSFVSEAKTSRERPGLPSVLVGRNFQRKPAENKHNYEKASAGFPYPE